MPQFALKSALLWLVATAVAAALPVEPTAQLFDLDQVRLLDGPFKIAQETDEAYILKLDPDRFLAWFRKEAGLTPKGEVYGGWESRGVAGQTGGHYMSALAQMYAATGDPEYKRRADYMVTELAACQNAIGTGYVAAIPNGKTLFAQIKAGQIDTEHGLNGGWVPWYTMHKELAGLLDIDHYCHNDDALVVAKRLADWVGDEISGLNHDQMQHMLEVEQGGMTEAVANLYDITHEDKYLALAKKFRHDQVFLPLSQGNDILDGSHANTQVPKFIGYQRVYELTGDAPWDAAAENFWKTVTRNRSWVIGGNSEHERFFPPQDFEKQMDDVIGPESCNSYNMLKLTEHVFQLHPDAPVMDYYERTLYNHILATIRPHQDGFIYYTSLSPGSYRTYSNDFNDMWCCVGTGLENPTRYGKAIYAHEGMAKLLVNLFIASTLDWSEAGLKLEQKTTFPEEQGSTLVFHPRAPKQFEIDVRYPAWVAPDQLKLTVNGEAQAVTAHAGEYASITREWKEGDTLRIETPMALHTEMLPHSTDYVSILYGPLVLAGKLGLEGLTEHDFTAQSMKATARLAMSQQAVIVRPVADIVAHLKPDPNASLTFVSDDLIKPRDVRMVPFYRLYNERYTVYWPVLDAAIYQQKLAQAAAAEAAGRALDAGTIDEVRPNEQQSEVDHQLDGEQTHGGDFRDFSWRDAGEGGWFSYRLRVDEKQPLEVACKYWGSDTGARTFDIQVDGTTIGTETLAANHPDTFIYKSYAIPPALVQGKKAVTVRFQGHPHNIAGGIFDCRIVKAGTVAAP